MKWNIVKLGDYINILSGYPFESNLFNESNGTPVIRIRDVKRGFTNTYYKGKVDSNFLITKGDILVGMDGEFNTARWSSEPALLNQRVCKITSKDKSKLSENYLIYFLPKKLKEIEDRTSFATVKHLSVKGINQIEIPLPPLHIQEQIADTLDKADALRRKDQELLQKYDELAQAVFYDMFGDPVKRNVDDALALSELCVLNPKKSEITLAEDAMVSFVPMEDVDEKGNVHAHKTREYKDVSTGFTYFRERDVLFAKITPCMENGKGGIACNLTNGVGFGSTEFHVIRPGSSLSSEFLSTLFSLKSVRKEAEKMMTGSAGQKRVPKTFFDAIKIGRINDQKVKSFDRAYQLVKSSRNGTQKCFSESSLLFKSLLSSFFS